DCKPVSLWTVQQHEWLRALGHPVLLLVGDPGLGATPADVVAPEAPRPQAAAGPDGRGRPAAARRAPPAASAPSLPPAVDDADAAADAITRGAPRADAAAKKAALAAARGARRDSPRAPLPLPAGDPLLQAIQRVSGLDADAFEAAARSW